MTHKNDVGYTLKYWCQNEAILKLFVALSWHPPSCTVQKVCNVKQIAIKVNLIDSKAD